MNLSKLMQKTLADNGASYSINNGDFNPTKGYFVGGFVESKVIPLEEFNQKHLKNFILCNGALLSQENTYLGTWIDIETNLVYIDVSMLIMDLVNALDTAILYDEIAIYDNEYSKSIYLQNYMQYIDFIQSLVHLRTKIFVPCLNANIDKTAFVSSNGYNSKLEQQAISDAYIKHIIG